MSTMPKPSMPKLRNLLTALAKHMGAKISLEPTWGVVGNLSFPTGKKAYFMFSSLLVNGTSEIVRDKDFTQFFLRSLGYPTVRKSQTFFTEAWADLYGSCDFLLTDAHAYAQTIGYPVFVKPNKGSQGRDVALAHNRRELEDALKKVFLLDHIALVQKPEPGLDIRIVVYRGKVVCAYIRHPLTLIGDGKSTIGSMLTKRLDITHAHLKSDDPRITRALTRAKKNTKSILKKDERVALLDNANLSTGGYAEDVTDSLHPSYKKLAISISKDFSLTLTGVDLLIDSDPTQKLTPQSHIVLEINSAPGLDHFATLGKTQKKIVEDLYRKILRDMASK